MAASVGGLFHFKPNSRSSPSGQLISDNLAGNHSIFIKRVDRT